MEICYPQLRDPWGVNSTKAAGFLKEQRNNRLWPKQLVWWWPNQKMISRQHVKVSSCVRPLPHPNPRLLFKHVSLTKQLMKHKETWIPPVSHFKTYRMMRKTLSWQNSSWLSLTSRPSLFSISVCCRHSNCKAPNTGPECHFLMYLGCHTEIALWTQQCFFLSCCAVVPQSKKQALKWVT